jgi:hypothetical protein
MSLKMLPRCQIGIAFFKLKLRGDERAGATFPHPRPAAAPELTHSAGIQLNERVSLLELIEIDNNNA